MKKTIGFLMVILLLTVTVNAQRQQKNGIRKGMNQTPEQIATLQSKKMALALNLDKKQQDAIYKLMKANAEERKVLREEMKSKKEDGTTLNSDQRFELRNNRLDKQIAHKNEMKKILNSEQFQKWEKMKPLNSRNRTAKMKKKFNNQKSRGRGNRSQGKL